MAQVISQLSLIPTANGHGQQTGMLASQTAPRFAARGASKGGLSGHSAALSLGLLAAALPARKHRSSAPRVPRKEMQQTMVPFETRGIREKGLAPQEMGALNGDELLFAWKQLKHSWHLPESQRMDAKHRRCKLPEGIRNLPEGLEGDAKTECAKWACEDALSVTERDKLPIKIARSVLDPSNLLLYDVYKPLGRCVAVVDATVDKEHGADFDFYFRAHGIEFIRIVCSGNEVEKDLQELQRILEAMKQRETNGRQEPLLVVGDDAMAALASRASHSMDAPYVMLCSSVSLITEAYSNGFELSMQRCSAHPILCIADRFLWNSVCSEWVQHALPEILQLAIMKDPTFFELMERWGGRCLETKFGTEAGLEDAELQDVCDFLILQVFSAADAQSWELGRRHGLSLSHEPSQRQAMGSCLGLAAYLSFKEGFITQLEMKRILQLIADCELALWHPLLEDGASWKSQLAENGGGSLRIPIPKAFGHTGYLNLSEETCWQRLKEYQGICKTYYCKRNSEEHCDVSSEEVTILSSEEVEDDIVQKLSKAAELIGDKQAQALIQESLELLSMTR
mmetsp:Transcript_91112/g.162172  ORF Transcript_91112/g.162172 Transcript_91112/m.162172 type:complete len:568 (-) Transcript_91112:117-1820(-)